MSRPISEASRMHRVWNERQLWLIAIFVAPVSFLASSALISLMEAFIPSALEGGGWAQVEASVSAGQMVYALSLAPVFENLILYAVVALLGKAFRADLPISCTAAMLAAMAHILASGQLSYVAVFPGFFVMSLLILRAKRRSTGYWLSVVHHVAVNSISVAGLLLRGHPL